MQPIIQATLNFQGKREVRDFQDCDEILARHWVEQGEGELVWFARSPNIPGLMPEVVKRSFQMESYYGSAWHSVSIF